MRITCVYAHILRKKAGKPKTHHFPSYSRAGGRNQQKSMIFEEPQRRSVLHESREPYPCHTFRNDAAGFFTPSCNFDGGDCYTFDRQRPMATSAVRCAWGCPDSWRGDGECDAGCNVTACNFDGGDCNCVPGAKRACVCSGVAGVGMQSCVGGTYGVCKCKDGAMKQVVSREEQRSTHAQNKHCPPHS